MRTMRAKLHSLGKAALAAACLLGGGAAWSGEIGLDGSGADYMISPPDISLSGRTLDGTGKTPVATHTFKGGWAIRITPDSAALTLNTLAFTDISVSNYATTHNVNYTHASNIYGPVLINGSTDPASLDHTTGLTGQQLFERFSLSNNSSTITLVDDTGYSSGFGGGARIGNMPDLVMNTGTVTGNSLSIIIDTVTGSDPRAGTGAHVNGGGMAIESEWTSKTAITNYTFRQNTAWVTVADTSETSGGAGTAARGGALFLQGTNDEKQDSSWSSADNTGMEASIRSSSFIGNLAKNEAGGLAGGGAVNAEKAVRLEMDNTVFSLNTASGETAQGGAVRFNLSDHYSGAANGELKPFDDSSFAKVSGSTFSGNKAAAAGAAGNAYGGAIFMNEGILAIADSSFTGNSASGLNAYGGAIYMDTSTNSLSKNSTGQAAVNLTASNGKTVLFQGNKANDKASGIHFGTMSGGGSAVDGVINIATSDSGTVSLLDPVSVDMNGGKSFYLNKTGTGTFNWDGENTFSTDGGNTLINLNGGTVNLGSSFSAVNTNNWTFNVTVGNNTAVSFSLSRDKDTALFDFTGTGSKDFSVGATGATFAANLDREILSFTDREYLIATGYDSQNATTNFEVEGFEFYENSGSLYAKASHKSSFERWSNPSQGQYALQRLVKQQNSLGGFTYSDAQVAAIRANPLGTTAEMFMNQGAIFMHTAGRYAENAVQIGLRNPFRTLQAEPYGGRRVASRGAYGNQYEYDTRGFRISAGYFGDFRTQDSHSGFAGYDTDTNGFVVGMNYDFSRMASVGFYGGYSYSKSKVKEFFNSETKSDNYHFGVAGRISPLASLPSFAFFGDVGYHFSKNDTHRWIGPYRASGKYDQNYWTVGIGAENTFCFGGLNLTPSAALRWAHLSQDDINESGLTRTHTDGISKSAFSSRVGAEVSYNFMLPTAIITPKAGAAWRHEFNRRSFSSSSYYRDAANPIAFRTNSTRNDRDSLDINLAVSSVLLLGGNTKMGVDVGYQFNVSRHTDSHTIYAGVSLGF